MSPIRLNPEGVRTCEWRGCALPVPEYERDTIHRLRPSLSVCETGIKPLNAKARDSTFHALARNIVGLANPDLIPAARYRSVNVWVRATASRSSSFRRCTPSPGSTGSAATGTSSGASILPRSVVTRSITNDRPHSRDRSRGRGADHRMLTTIRSSDSAVINSRMARFHTCLFAGEP